VHELAVAAHIRLALDDDCAPVTTAAAFALAALVCPSDEDAALEEATDGCPQTGSVRCVMDDWGRIASRLIMIRKHALFGHSGPICFLQAT